MTAEIDRNHEHPCRRERARGVAPRAAGLAAPVEKQNRCAVGRAEDVADETNAARALEHTHSGRFVRARHSCIWTIDQETHMVQPITPEHAPIPRVPGLPVLGNLLEFRRDRLGFVQRVAREHGPLVRFKIAGYHVVLVSSPELAHEVLVERFDDFHQDQALRTKGKALFGTGLLTSDHALHKRQRRMMAPAFVHKRIATFADLMAMRSDAATARWPDGETVDVSAEMMRMTLEVVGKALFDAEISGDADEIGRAMTIAMEHFIDSVNAIVPIPDHWPTPSNLRHRFAIRSLDKIVERLVRERRASGADRGDFLSMLLHARDTDDSSVMTDQQVRDEVMTLLLAGHETTANALSWAFHLLGERPDVRACLEQEVDEVLGDRLPTAGDVPRLPSCLRVFKEVLRLYPPAYLVGREAAKDLTLGGRPIRRGTFVFINIYGMHHLPALFADPERFDPDRFLPEREARIDRYAYLPFGAGPRVCIGSHFAMLEGQLALATIARKVRFESVPGAAPEPAPLITLRPNNLQMRVARRSPRA